MTREIPPLSLHRAKMQDGFTLVELLLVIAIIAILAVLGSMGASSMTEKARGLECVMNLRALGRGFQQYVIDHQGMLPIRTKPVNTPVNRQWHREIWPSYRHEEDAKEWSDARVAASKENYKKWAFSCPADRAESSATPGLSYAVNIQLTDARVAKVRPKQVLLIELKGKYMANGSTEDLESLANRHKGHNHVLFADYHVEALRAINVPSLDTEPDAWKILD